jgi:2-polyprenyl-3-methyl-5-hydroxy-6-metoxy-1,4-benzoquinol methylase
MKNLDLETYRCPACRGQLSLKNERVAQEAEVERGQLTCTVCGMAYPIVNAIPRFAPESNYAESFGLEWAMFPRTLLDENWQSSYKDRFFRTTDFPQSLSGQKVLEVGCGPGNFTGIILGTGARLFSFDLSNAVDACRQNSRIWTHRHLLSLSQSDIAALPFAYGSFDKIVCLGVIQHCPDPENAFSCLCRFLKPGGEIVIDCYQKQPFPRASVIHMTKHLLRMITKRMPPRTLFHAVRGGICKTYDVKMALSKIPRVGNALHRVIPIGKLKRYDWNPEQMKQIKTLNVFDMLSPMYDFPQRLETVRNWIMNERLELIKCDLGYNGINAKARRPI